MAGPRKSKTRKPARKAAVTKREAPARQTALYHPSRTSIASRRTPSRAHKPLSERERQVLAGIGDGWTNNQIGDYYGISVRTVETHRERLMYKLNARGTAQLTKWAIKLKLTSLEP